jgi:hypothetical protein
MGILAVARLAPPQEQGFAPLPRRVGVIHRLFGLWLQGRIKEGEIEDQHIREILRHAAHRQAFPLATVEVA